MSKSVSVRKVAITIVGTIPGFNPEGIEFSDHTASPTATPGRKLLENANSVDVSSLLDSVTETMVPVGLYTKRTSTGHLATVVVFVDEATDGIVVSDENKAAIKAVCKRLNQVNVWSNPSAVGQPNSNIAVVGGIPNDVTAKPASYVLDFGHTVHSVTAALENNPAAIAYVQAKKAAQRARKDAAKLEATE